MRIFIHRGTRTFGPYSLDDVRHELGNGGFKPTDMATYDGGGDRFVPLSAVPGVGGTASARPGAPRSRAPLGCGGWIAVAVGVIFLIGLVGSLVTKDNDTSPQAQPQRHLSPREFGRRLGRELLRHASTDDGTKGMYYFAQGCRTENPTVKTYSEAEFSQFYTDLIEAYTEWRVHGYVVPDSEIETSATPAAANERTSALPPNPSRPHTPRPPYPYQARTAHITGTGTCRIAFGADGHVASAVMIQSTGSDILDSNTTEFVKANWTGTPNTTKDFPFEYQLQ